MIRYMTERKVPQLTLNPLSWLRWWITPRNVHPEVSFRERSIRLFLTIFVPMSAFTITSDIINGNFPRMLVIYAIDISSAVVFAALSIYLVHRGKINAAGTFVSLILIRSAFFGAFNNGAEGPVVAFALLFFLVFTALVLPAKYIIPSGIGIIIADLFGLLLSVELGVTAFVAAQLPAVIISLSVILLGLGIPLTYLRAQLDFHIEELLKLVENLDRKVEERTVDLEEANQQLQEMSIVKDEFVSNVSHELRTPIAGLKLRQHLLSQQPDQVTRHLAVMKRETDRLELTIEDLLQLSNLDQQQKELRRHPVNLALFIKQFVFDRALLIEQRDLTLKMDIAEEKLVVQADEGLLSQVLSVLVTNASNYTPAGGTITVSTCARMHMGKSWMGFSVADTGPGIDEKDQNQLFERFFRGKVGRESGQNGTGLGLSLAKEIVDRHAGQIAIDSNGVPGEGTTFYIWLPSEDSL